MAETEAVDRVAADAQGCGPGSGSRSFGRRSADQARPSLAVNADIRSTAPTTRRVQVPSVLRSAVSRASSSGRLAWSARSIR